MSIQEGGGGSLEVLLQQAVALHRSGDLDGAEQVYRNVLRLSPGDPHSTHYLGLIALQRGHAEEAVKLIRAAIAITPSVAEFHVNLGNAEKRAGNRESAEEAYRQALLLRPDFFPALYNLALVQEARGDLSGALATLQRAQQVEPSASGVLTATSQLLRRLGRWADALKCSQRAVDAPNATADSWQWHGELLMSLDDWRGAARCLRRAATRFPNAPPLLDALGCALDGLGEYTEAAAFFKAALALRDDFAPAWANLAATLKNQGRMEDALSAYRRAILIDPANAGLRSGYLFTLLMADNVPLGELSDAHRGYADLADMHGVARPPASEVQLRPRSALRVGYLSGDLRNHPVGYFLQGILANHDPGTVEVFCYHTGAVEDALSARLKELVAQWVSCAHLDDDALAERIQADGIDILVELSGHTAGNRLLMMARRPAPVQVSYLGYAHATCLPWIDYRISDRWADPAGATAGEAAEPIVRLPHSYYCYTPPDNLPAVTPLPAAKSGSLTFGAFLQLGKLSATTRELWARVLCELPGTRLIIRAKGLSDKGTRDLLAEDLGRRGVLRERLILEGWSGHGEHLSAYRRVDCMLDTFPFNLATNTCEALWMGVPTITLCGDRHPGRMGDSILTTAGLERFVAHDAEGFVAIARGLAADIDGLSKLRAVLRSQVSASPLADAVGQARALERLYRQMWSAKLAGGSGGRL